MELTGGHGVDRVVEVDLSGNAPQLYRFVAPGGVVAAYGSNDQNAAFPFSPSIGRCMAVRFYIVYSLNHKQRAAAVGALNAWMQAGLVRHAIASRVPLAACADAHRAVEAGKLMGNVVLEC